MKANRLGKFIKSAYGTTTKLTTCFTPNLSFDIILKRLENSTLNSKSLTADN